MQFSVIDQSGAAHSCTAAAGETLMQAIRDSGLEIAAQCGGCCSCATCHVYVSSDWGDVLPTPSEDELAMLELAMEVGPRSRLSCQIVLGPELSGVSVTLAPGTLV